MAGDCTHAVPGLAVRGFHRYRQPVNSSPKPLRIWLIIETILGVPAVLMGGFAAMMSPMMFDAPGSMENPWVVTFFWSVVAFPVVCVLAILLGWIFYATRRYRAALWFSLTPIIPIVTGIAAAMGW